MIGKLYVSKSYEQSSRVSDRSRVLLLLTLRNKRTRRRAKRENDRHTERVRGRERWGWCVYVMCPKRGEGKTEVPEGERNN